MTTRPDDRRAFLQLLLASCALPARGFARQDNPPIGNGISLDARTSSYHVHPRGRIQDALDAAARDPVNKTVYVHAGTYRPATRGQALIWFNARHDGITLEAVGDVTLTASNPEIADSRAPSYPAVVNHVVYFGDGVSRKTVLRGFKITGARNFTTGSGDKSPIESDDLRKTAPKAIGVLAGRIGLAPRIAATSKRRRCSCARSPAACRRFAAGSHGRSSC